MASKIRRADVAYALDIPRKRFENWIERRLVTLAETTISGDGWADFSLNDLAHLAIVNDFTAFHISVADADMLACTAEETLALDHADRIAEPDPHARWAGLLICVQRSDDDATFFAVSVTEKMFRARAAIFLDPAQVISAAMARLADRLRVLDRA